MNNNQKAKIMEATTDTKEDAKGVVHKPLVKFIQWAVINGLFAWGVWLAINGSEGAGRLVGFFAWTMGPLQFLGGLMEDVRKSAAKRGRSVPAWLSNGWDIALIGFLVFHGWINVAIALLLSALGELMTFSESNGKKNSPKVNPAQ